MTTPFYYSTTYVLDKSHFSETFDESTPVKTSIMAYAKPVGLMIFGSAILYYTELSPYAAWFIIILGFVDACSVYFRKQWWLARQMISDAANTELTLTLDENGVSSKSFSVDIKVLWDEVTKIEKTPQGWLLYHASGKNYLSDRCLSESSMEFLSKKALLKSPPQ